MRNALSAIILALLIMPGCTSVSSWQTWSTEHGGLLEDRRTQRADHIAAQLTGDLGTPKLTVGVIDSDVIGAYAFPDRHVFVTRGLADTATDAQLAAAFAHEIGHLLADGHIAAPAALHAPDESLDTESRADLLGCQVLAAQGYPPAAMIEMLGLVAAGNPCCQKAIANRVHLLKSTLNARLQSRE